MPDNFICGKCGKVAKTKQALERHAAYHEDDRPFSCEVCLQRFKNSDDRGKHYRRLKRDGKFSIACTVCHKHFKTDEILQKHVEMLGCNVTAAGERDNELTGENIVAITLNEDNVLSECITCTCKMCETVFSNTSALKKHYKEVHNDNKRQVCIQCGQTLSSKDSLARHFSIFHQSSFPYACDLCDQKFKIKESLCRHVKFVHQDGGYQCHECHRVFSQPVNLRKHLAIHSTLKEFACKLCGREFRWKQALQKHELLHETHTLMDESTGPVNKPVNRTAEKRLDVDEKIKGKADKAFDDFCNVITHDKIIQDEISSESGSVNDEMKVKCTDSGINSHVKKLPTVFVSGESDLKKNVSVKSQSASRKHHVVDEYDFPEEDDNTTNYKVNSVACLKRMKFSDRLKCIESKKPIIVGSSRLTDKSHCIDIDDEKTDKMDNLNPESLETNGMDVMHLQNGENTADGMDDSVNAESGDTTEDEHTREDNEEISRNSEKRKSDSEQSEVITENDVGLKKLKLAALTSFPTNKIKNAPRLLFKPSSIQTIMSGPTKAETANSSSSDEKSDEEGRPSNRASGFKFPSANGSVYTKLNNPFIIPNSSLRMTPNDENKKCDSVNSNEIVIKNLHGLSKTLSAPKEQIIPAGKFSLVKHMLSLQNEDNFDKTIFENPLYNKPADIKDFEHMVERHRVTDKTDDTIIQSYDLSAKQNIPFHWLGMSVAKRKASSDGGEQKNSTESDIGDKPEQNFTLNEEKKYTDGDNNSTDSFAKDTVKENFGEVSVESDNTEQDKVQNDKELVHKTNPFYGQIQESRGYQAMKNLVAKRQLADKSKWNAGNSVLTNPFDYENKYFQDNPGDHLNDKHAISFVKVHNFSGSQNMAHSTKTSVAAKSSTDNDNPVLQGNRELDLSQTNRTLNKQKQFIRQHSLDIHPEPSVYASSSHISKHNIQTHSRTLSLSESHSTSETLASLNPFSRSLSIPFTPVVSNRSQQQKMWGSDSSIISKYRLQNMFAAASTSSHTPTFTSLGHSEGSVQSLNGGTKFNNGIVEKSNSDVNHSMTEMPSRVTLEKQINLTMSNRNLSQLQKLRQGRLNNIDTESAFRHHGSLPNMHENVTDSSQWFNNVHSSFDKGSQMGGSQNFSKEQFKKTMINERDLLEVDVFDAYTMVHSPYRTDLPHSADGGTCNLSPNIDPQTRSQATDQSPQMFRKSEGVGKLPVSVNASQVETCMVVANEIVSAKRVEDIKSKNACHEIKGKTQISIFDLLKGGEERGKEYDNVDSLLGAYT